MLGLSESRGIFNSYSADWDGLAAEERVELADLIGNKAMNILRLQALQPRYQGVVNTKPSFVVTAEAFGHYRKSGDSRAYRNIPQPYLQEAESALAEYLRAHPSQILFARSSAPRVEDPENMDSKEGKVGMSFQGKFETIPCAPADVISRGVVGCFESALTPEIESLRRERGINVEMAVVVQRYFDSEKSILIATGQRISGVDGCTRIQAGLGDCWGLVDGKVDSDTIVLRPDGSLLKKSRNGSEEGVRKVAKLDRQTFKMVVREVDYHDECLLTDDEISLAHRLAQAIDVEFKPPNDIEASFGVDYDGVRRLVTHQRRREPPAPKFSF